MDKNRKVILFATVILLAISIGYYQYFQNKSQKFYVAFLNVGQGDSALINFGNGKKMLVDCGVDRSILSALGRQLPFYDRKIDYLLITHPDSDHYGGCIDVLKRYQIDTVITNGETKPHDGFWQIWNQAVKDEKAISDVVNSPKELHLGDLQFQFLSPDPDFILADKDRTSNNKSIIFKLTKDNDSFLFMGDAEIPVENNLIKKYCSTSTPSCSVLQVDILKVGHHGSDTASGEEFLSVVKPKITVISVGKNKFGHPSLRVERHLERVGAQILRTDQKGDIILP